MSEQSELFETIPSQLPCPWDGSEDCSVLAKGTIPAYQRYFEARMAELVRTTKVPLPLSSAHYYDCARFFAAINDLPLYRDVCKALLAHYIRAITTDDAIPEKEQTDV